MRTSKEQNVWMRKETSKIKKKQEVEIAVATTGFPLD